MRLVRAATQLAVSALLTSLIACGDANDSLRSANAAIARGDTKAAIIDVKDALQRDQSSAEGRFLLGKLLLGSGQFAGAIVELRKASELKVSKDQVAPLIAKAMVSLQQDKKVIDEFESFKSSDPTTAADVSALVALSMMRLGQSAQSQALVATVLSRMPQHIPSLLVRARQQASEGSLDAALASVDLALGVDPRDANSLQLRGDLIFYGKHDAAAAADAYTRVLASQSNNVSAHSALIGIALSRKDFPQAKKYFDAMKLAEPSNVQTRYVEAQIAAASGDFKKASELMPILLKLVPDNARLQLFAGYVELSGNSVGKAITHLNKAVGLAPDLESARILLARAHLRSAQPEKTLEVLRPLLPKESTQAEVLAIAAEAYLLLGQIPNAEVFLQRAAKINPHNTKARTTLALTKLARGRTEQGFSELQEISSADKDTFADLALVDVRLRRNELAGALKAIDVLASKQPTSPIADQLRGQVYLRQHDLKLARASFDAALAKDPVYFPAVSSLVKLDFSERRPDVAKQRLERVLQVDPKSAMALLALADLRALSGGTKDEVAQWLGKAVAASPENPMTHLRLIEHWLAFDDTKAAAAAVQAGLTALPEAPELVDALGRIQMASGEIQQAINTFGKLSISQPKSPGPLLRLAKAQSYAKDDVAAVRSVGQAIELAPDLPAAQRDFLALALASKKPDGALLIARRIQSQRPSHAIGFRLEGDIQMEFKAWDSALQSYRAGLSKEQPRLIPERIYIALLSAKRPAEAEQFAIDWTKKNPSDAKFRSFLGENLMVKQDYARAQNHFQIAVKLDPNDAVALNNLAYVMTKNKQHGAVPFAEKAVLLAPENPALLDTLSLALLEESQFDKAIEAAKSALWLAPSDSNYRFNLAKAYLRSGNKSAAKDELSQLVKLGAKFSAQGEVASLLRSL